MSSPLAKDLPATFSCLSLRLHWVETAFLPSLLPHAVPVLAVASEKKDVNSHSDGHGRHRASWATEQRFSYVLILGCFTLFKIIDDSKEFQNKNVSE